MGLPCSPSSFRNLTVGTTCVECVVTRSTFVGFAVLVSLAVFPACGSGEGESSAASTSGTSTAAAAKVTPAEFVEACVAYHNSDLASHPDTVTAETFCQCILVEMDDTLSGIMQSLQDNSQGSMSDDYKTSYTSSTVAKMAVNYRNDLAANRNPGWGDEGYDAVSHGTEGVASTECYVRYLD